MKSGPKPRPLKDRLKERITIDPNSKCWIWTGGTNGTYGVIGGTSHTKKSLSTHRASYQEFKGPIPHGMCVCHKCDRGLCINPDHLFLGTHKDNVRDKINKNRQHVPLSGEKAPSAKLKRNDILMIRSMYASGEYSYLRLAKKFNICATTCQKIVKKLKWSSV